MMKYLITGVLFFLMANTQAQVTVPANAKKNLQNSPRITTAVPKIKLDSLPFNKTVSVTPSSITNLCPWVKLRGDNDFANNEVTVSVNIHYVYNRRDGDSVLKANIALAGEEHRDDRSSVKGEWQKVVYRAPAGYRIKDVTTGTNSQVTYFTFRTDVTVKPQDELCRERRYSPANFGYDVTMPTVKSIMIAVHRTNGDDFDTVESTCQCGFRLMKVEFKPVTILLERK